MRWTRFRAATSPSSPPPPIAPHDAAAVGGGGCGCDGAAAGGGDDVVNFPLSAHCAYSIQNSEQAVFQPVVRIQSFFQCGSGSRFKNNLQ